MVMTLFAKAPLKATSGPRQSRLARSRHGVCLDSMGKTAVNPTIAHINSLLALATRSKNLAIAVFQSRHDLGRVRATGGDLRGLAKDLQQLADEFDRLAG